jgi:hypothetical protein
MVQPEYGAKYCKGAEFDAVEETITEYSKELLFRNRVVN